MKFIYCFNKDLKNKFLQNGFELLVETDSFFIFKNSPSIKFNFEEIDVPKVKV
ncbi:MAG: hypothetical protein PWQ45_1518, partial [Thermosipho sp. (in: thermotogales)]|nr:hypothetical protein [Thermosipho sp. (in: thermotogales)]